METDQLVMTNGAVLPEIRGAGYFDFNGGTLNVSSATVNNGALFTVGNGTAATYRLVGAVTNIHSFAKGLLISTNATLTGNGTILGGVTNYGTLSPGNSAGVIRISANLIFQPSATAVFELGGRTATNGYDQITVTNFVQFAGSLDLRLTNNFLPAPGDTFTLVKFASSSGTFNGVWNGLRIPFFGGKASFFVTYDTNLTLSAVQYADTDGDGQPDLFEQAAGTDATNAASVLRLVPVSVNPAGAVTLRFPYVGGKSYRMHWTDSVASNAWNVITAPVLVENVAGSYDWVDDGTLTGGLATPARAYRVGLAP
jgi:hypothetical protein